MSENQASGEAKHVGTWRGRPILTEEEMRAMDCPWPPEVDWADPERIGEWMGRAARRILELEARNKELLGACKKNLAALQAEYREDLTTPDGWHDDIFGRMHVYKEVIAAIERAEGKTD